MKKPSIKEIAEYCRYRGNSVDAELFFYHYESNGWMVGKTKMKSWKAAVITWEKQQVKFNGKENLPRTNEDWEAFGKSKGELPKRGETYPQYINRLRNLI